MISTDRQFEFQTWPVVAGRRNRGVTLIELMVVISIMAAVALLVIPQIRTISKDRSQRETARTFKTALDEAITRARVDGFGGIVIARNPNVYRLADSTGQVPDTTGNALVSTGSKVYYGGHVIYQMRLPRTYYGNTSAEVADINPTMTPPLPPLPANQFRAFINAPFDSRVVIEPGCRIYLGNSPTGFLILTVSSVPGTPDPGPPPVPPRLMLVCSQESFEVTPRNGTASFRIQRRPEIVAASAVAIPKGHFINLNYSGSPDMPRNPPAIPDLDGNDFTWTDLVQDLLPIDRTDPVLNDVAYQAANTANPISFPRYVDPNTQPVMILFGRKGNTEAVYPYGILVDSWVRILQATGMQGYTNPVLYRTGYVPSAPLSFCISTDEFENSFSLDNTTAGYEMPLSFSRAQKDLLNDNVVQWVTVDNTSGDVSVADSIQVPGPLTDPGAGNMAAMQAVRILNARGFAANNLSTKD